MPDVPHSPNSSDAPDDQEDLQGYQDDFDTAKRDQLSNDEAEDPYGGTPATRAEFAQGLRDSAAPSQEGGIGSTDKVDAEPPLASQDDYREDIEDRDEDDKERPDEPWQ